MDNISKYFFDEPNREFHIRELAKITKKSPTTVSKYLKDLKKNRIVVSRKALNHALFKANDESKSFKYAKLAYNLKKLAESGLIEFIIEKFNNPVAIILFGSYAKAEDGLQSDIDLLIITPLKKQLDLSKFERMLNRKIQFFMHSDKEINNMKIKNRELLNSFINGIMLYGFWEFYK